MEMDSQGSKEIKTASPFVGLQSSGAISAHCVLDLLGSRDNPNSASQVSATTEGRKLCGTQGRQCIILLTTPLRDGPSASA
ncbi:uncharacterized protein LOC144330015 isoform X1 [Macaca mulatta]